MAWWKTPWSAPAIGAWNQLGWWPVARVQDGSDILAVAMAPLAWAYAQRARPFLVPELARCALAACSLAVFMGQNGRENLDKRVVADRCFIAPGTVSDVQERGLLMGVQGQFFVTSRGPSLLLWFKDGGYQINAIFGLVDEQGGTSLRVRDARLLCRPIDSPGAALAAPVPPEVALRQRASCMESITRLAMAPFGAAPVLLEPAPAR